ncbi:hypothetical protein [Bradyrhizobium sp. CB2312]|uniref:hypothetical protein n=1 Tax=Bradyrhizobium sp. CB2312 TaxID=3039155 RepID=UPI0024B24288|nr:hypothetical protein [Bradyrhizobium sp. CB2312]WFU75508.1 hypothetical protein QA642_16600 [Bradyrhizobium sp. CB2312]
MHRGEHYDGAARAACDSIEFANRIGLLCGEAQLFETMIFGGWLDQFQNRCSTWVEAEAMHDEAVDQVRRGHLRVIK